MYDIFVQLCKKKGVTPYKVCKDLGIWQTTISAWKNRGDGLNAKYLVMIANYFGVSVEYLLGGTDYQKNEEDNVWEPTDKYYIDEQSRELAEFLLQNPDYKVLFDASRKVKPEDLQKALKAIGIFIDD